MSSVEFELEVMTHAHDDAIASLVAACKQAAKYQRERDAALAKVKRQATTLMQIRAIVADPGAALVADRVRAALEAAK